MSHKPRVRFAPSPTGNLHIGGMRTALFNWLFARHHGGTFLLRIEDTDLQRSKKQYVDAQLAALRWCGLESDEPLVFQSERIAAYQELLARLFQENKIYRCTCSPEHIEQRVRAAGNTDHYFKYDQFCRNRAIGADSTEPFVIRFAVPDDVQDIVIEDLIRGTVRFESAQFDDFIIIRSDGSPTYNFVVIVDDAFMKITHVIRGDDHLTNAPKQVLLYRACGFEPPIFAHIPLITNPDGHRLSKRDGAVDVLQYRQEGYLAEALVNYCVRLGWAHGDQELFTRDELVQYFTLEAVGKKAAVFDIQKLQWLNSVYLKQMAPRDCFDWLERDVTPDLRTHLATWSDESLFKAVALYQERAKTGSDLSNALTTLHDGPSLYERDDVKKWIVRESYGYLNALLPCLQALEPFDAPLIADAIKAFCNEHACKLVAVAQPLRIALTGGATSPGVFELLSVLGKEESIKRIHALQRFLESR